MGARRRGRGLRQTLIHRLNLRISRPAFVAMTIRLQQQELPCVVVVTLHIATEIPCFGVRLIAAYQPGRGLVTGDLRVDFSLQSDEARGGHPDAGPSAGDLEQTEDDVALVAALNEVLRLEEQRVPQSETVATPGEEVGDVVSALEGTGLHALAELDRGKRRYGSGTAGTGCGGTHTG